MKILIISDSHSNYDALNEISEKEQNIDYIIFAGDMIDCGFFPKETVKWFAHRKDKLFAVKGNHDELILNRRNEPKSEINITSHDYTLNHLGGEDFDFLEALPKELTFTLGDTDFYLCHTVENPQDEIYIVENNIPGCSTKFFLDKIFENNFPRSKSKNRVAIFGHSHLQWVSAAGENGLIINPGSVSHKFNGEPAGIGDYIVLENGTLRFGHINYETEHLYAMADNIQDNWHAELMRKIYER